jgi:aminopeptidase YwaD
MKQTYLILLVFTIAIFLTNCKHPSNPDITKEELKEHISYLASDSLKGRKPGTPGGRLAAEYIRDFFKESGMDLPAEEGMQYFDVVTNIELGENNALSFNDYNAAPQEEFVPFSFSSNGELESEVAFVGYGFDISTDSLKWNDYENIDIEGKWVMILRGDPELDKTESVFAEYSDERAKALTAKDKGAAGILFVSGPAVSENDELVSLFFDKSLSGSGIPLINIKRSLANEIIKSSGNTIEGLSQNIDSLRQIISFNTNVSLKASTDLHQTKVKTQNVIGIIESDDPEYKDEYIVIGAHYDHLGMGGPGSGSRKPDTIAVHNGADDNASGVAGIMEIARNLAAIKADLKRSVVVIAFAAEEMGLLGSKYFIDNSVVDLSKVMAMVNLDMIGRLKPDTRAVLISGTGTSIEAEAILDELQKGTDLDLNYSPEGYGASDHSSFYGKDIPVFFISTGAHGDYHTPEDDIEFIDFDGALASAIFVDSLMYKLINFDSTLTFQMAGPKSKPRHGRGFKVTLGIMPDFTSTDNTGLGVDFVRPDGPAAAGGMKKGDRIIAIEGKEVTNIYDYMNRLKKLKEGQLATVDIIRDGKTEVLLIQL